MLHSKNFLPYRNTSSKSTIFLGKVLASIENCIQQDEGNRGISSIVLPGELFRCTKSIFAAKNVAILTGFPCLLSHSPPTETDGPPGAAAIARACLALGKSVTILTDEVNKDVLEAACLEPGLHNDPNFSIQGYLPRSEWNDDEEDKILQIADQTDCVVAIERPGPAQDGRYYTMSGREMPPTVVAPLERLVERCSELGKPSVGIGDGGNEVGMGKIADRIIASEIPKASLICSRTATSHLLVSSVSNWGGYAVAAGLQLQASLTSNGKLSRERHNMEQSFLPTPEQEEQLLARMIQWGARDGVTGKKRASVDGIPLEGHLDVLSNIKLIIQHAIVSKDI